MKIKLSEESLDRIYPTKKRGERKAKKRTYVRQLDREVTEDDSIEVEDGVGRALIASGLMEQAKAAKKPSSWKSDIKENE